MDTSLDICSGTKKYPYLCTEIDGRQVDWIKLFQGVLQVHVVANTVIKFLIKVK